MQSYGRCRAHQHEKMNEWRDALRGGITYKHPDRPSCLRWGGRRMGEPRGELIIVDYKATSKMVKLVDADWQDGYKRQMEIYQWLFRKNNFTVSTQVSSSLQW